MHDLIEAECRDCHQPYFHNPGAGVHGERCWECRKTTRASREVRRALMEKQGNRCAICGREVDLVLDHDHGTGKNRGMLCNLCNLLLGHAGDNVERLQSAIDYLKAHGK